MGGLAYIPSSRGSENLGIQIIPGGDRHLFESPPQSTVQTFGGSILNLLKYVNWEPFNPNKARVVKLQRRL